jgi:glycosyltransferase involved in cell wall biosynthesis
MNILHVNFADLPGRRFSGYDLLDDLAPLGFGGKQLVLTKFSDDPRVEGLLCSGEERLTSALWHVEQRHGMDGLLRPWGRLVAESALFADADVVHYHVIHLNMVSLLDLPRLFNAKPSVWTFHDAWPLTGHCIQPRTCDGWLEGCAHCPHLDWALAIERDCADKMWRLKKQIYARINPDIVVASSFMRDLVLRSPLTRHFDRVHQVPFGIHLEQYLPDSEKTRSRALLGIGPEQFVLMFRSTGMEHKGLDLLVEALSQSPPTRPTTLLAVDERGLLGRLRGDYRVVELGWVQGTQDLARALCACDVFVMSSLAEGFGLMALEAMASARPVICFQDTAVAAVTHAPSCGLAVPLGDATALRSAIDLLAVDPAEARRRGEMGRSLAQAEYRHDKYLQDLAALYQRAARRGASAPHRGGSSSRAADARDAEGA